MIQHSDIALLPSDLSHASVELPIVERFMPGRIGYKALVMIYDPLDAEVCRRTKNDCQGEGASHALKHVLP